MSYKQQVKEAVDDPEWQEFRISLKGLPTTVKLSELRSYWRDGCNAPVYDADEAQRCVVCVRVDNYIKALCRGGQLYPGEDLKSAIEWDFKLRIRK